MKKYYYKNIILLIAFFCGNSVSSIAQVQDDVINDPGDIAIVSYHGGTTAQPMLAFVLLDNCPANTVITFTDEEYLTTTSAFAGTEGELTWTNNTGAAIGRGTVIRIESVAPSHNWNLINTSSGTTSETIDGFQMNTNDQIMHLLELRLHLLFLLLLETWDVRVALLVVFHQVLQMVQRQEMFPQLAHSCITRAVLLVM